MYKFCQEIEGGKERKKYHDRLKDIAKWYKSIVEKYSAMMAKELDWETMYNSIVTSEDELPWSSDPLYNNAKLSFFKASDTLVKLILSKYSYGPSKSFLDKHDIIYANADYDYTNVSWLDYNANEITMTEILAKVLKDEIKAFPFDLSALLTNRKVRNRDQHAFEKAICMTAIRCYENIRKMIVFIDSELETELPIIPIDIPMNYNDFVAAPCNFGFDDSVTILVAGSCHDIPIDQMSNIANMPWDIVIDFDGYSNCGGLLSNVAHNRLQKDILVSNKTVTMVSGSTMWYICGDYQLTNYVPAPEKDNIQILSYVCFHQKNGVEYLAKTKQQTENIKTTFSKVLREASKTGRFINIIVLNDNPSVIEGIVNAAYDSLDDDYFITWVGLSDIQDNVIENWYGEDEAYMNQHFRRFLCPITSFFQTMKKYSSSYRHRVKLETSYSLPSIPEYGRVYLGENERANLAPYFDVLYDACEHIDDENCDALQEDFYKGNKASWNTIANGYAIGLMEQSDIESIKKEIRKRLLVTQKVRTDRLFFIKHSAGIGGTTFARQLAWDLHNEYAVLEVKKYESNTIISLIENLYDNVLHKAPIIILAEDTLPSIKSLCNDICSTARRCILIVSCRETSSLVNEEYRKVKGNTLKGLPNITIQSLKTRFRQYSKLSEEEKREKDSYFDDAVYGNALTPFIIGLYYIERDFNIDSYVNKALEGCSDEQARVLACFAMCDVYNSKNVPASFAKYALSPNSRYNFLSSVPGAESLIRNEKTSSGLEVYHFKHRLLSEKFFTFYCKKYYGGEEKRDNAIYNLAFYFINVIATICGRKQINEEYIDIIKNIFIQRRNPKDKVSALLKDIGFVEQQKELMKYLAEKFQPYADDIIMQASEAGDRDFIYTDREILRLVSHFYAHLGRMYVLYDHNYGKAEELFSISKKYMPDNDPDIYHMMGISKLSYLKDKWKTWEGQKLEVEEFNSYYSDVKNAHELFNSTAKYGSPEYGIPCILELYYEFLRFIYRVKGVHEEGDVSKLTDDQRQLQIDFLSVLEEAKSFSGSDRFSEAEERVREYEDYFKLNIMFGKYSKAIEYYQNLVDKYKGTSNLTELAYAQKGLVFSRINQAKTNSNGRSFVYSIKDPTQLMSDIIQLLDRQFDYNSYNDYVTRTQLYHYWMILAKHKSVAIYDGLRIARQWLGMEERMGVKKNFEPYYYTMVLHYLNSLNGSKQAMIDASKTASMIRRYIRDSYFDERRQNSRRICDLIITGNGMGQLLDVRLCYDESSILKEVVLENKTPVELHGILTEIKDKSRGVITIYDPHAWQDENVRIEIGRLVHNSLSIQQIEHKIAFMAGFSSESMIALPGYAKDINVGDEPFDLQSILSEIRESMEAQTVARRDNVNTMNDLIDSVLPTVQKGNNNADAIINEDSSVLKQEAPKPPLQGEGPEEEMKLPFKCELRITRIDKDKYIHGEILINGKKENASSNFPVKGGKKNQNKLGQRINVRVINKTKEGIYIFTT